MIGVQSVSNNSYQSIVTAVQQENKESLANSKSAQVSSVKDSFESYDYEEYTNRMKKYGITPGYFGDPFGYAMHDRIIECMQNYYDGKITESEVLDFYQKCCQDMRSYRVYTGQTTGDNENDNKRIITEVYEYFCKENQRHAIYANNKEGEQVNKQYNDKKDYVYYNAKYYHECMDMKSQLADEIKKIADNWQVKGIDVTEIENNTSLCLDGKFDFNSGWNAVYRKNMGYGSIEEESMVPPKDFIIYFKESLNIDNSDDSIFMGGLEIQGNGKKIFSYVPFYDTGNDLHGNIYNAFKLIQFNNKEYDDCIKKFDIFQRWYAYASGINHISGNHIPGY